MSSDFAASLQMHRKSRATLATGSPRTAFAGNQPPFAEIRERSKQARANFALSAQTGRQE